MTVTRTATEITQTGYSTKISSDRSIDLCVLLDAYHKLFCVCGNFCVSGTQDAEVKKITATPSLSFLSIQFLCAVSTM